MIEADDTPLVDVALDDDVTVAVLARMLINTT